MTLDVRTSLLVVSGTDADDEDNPKKKAPKWAKGGDKKISCLRASGVSEGGLGWPRHIDNCIPVMVTEFEGRAGG